MNLHGKIYLLENLSDNTFSLKFIHDRQQRQKLEAAISNNHYKLLAEAESFGYHQYKMDRFRRFHFSDNDSTSLKIRLFNNIMN